MIKDWQNDVLISGCALSKSFNKLNIVSRTFLVLVSATYLLNSVAGKVSWTTLLDTSFNRCSEQRFFDTFNTTTKTPSTPQSRNPPNTPTKTALPPSWSLANSCRHKHNEVSKGLKDTGKDMQARQKRPQQGIAAKEHEKADPHP